MLDIPAVMLNAFGLATVAFVGQLLRWFPRRVRLMAKVERLGTLYALMPESPQKASFHRHVVAAIEELDEWLDISNVSRRRIVISVQWVLSIGAVAALSVYGGPDLATSPAWMVGAGAAAGLAIAVIASALESVLQRRAQRLSEIADAENEEALATSRRAAIARGELPVRT